MLYRHIDAVYPCHVCRLKNTCGIGRLIIIGLGATQDHEKGTCVWRTYV
jgi:hypothetical protein